jgi:hypothetical protein
VAHRNTASQPESIVLYVIVLKYEVYAWVSLGNAMKAKQSNLRRNQHTISRYLIRFFVRVPVLSEQMTDVDPRASTMSLSFTYTLFLTSLAQVIDSRDVTVAGRPASASTASERSSSRKIAYNSPPESTQLLLGRYLCFEIKMNKLPVRELDCNWKATQDAIQVSHRLHWHLAECLRS